MNQLKLAFFEGRIPSPESPISWGAALALHLDGYYVNLVSGTKLSRESIDGYVEFLSEIPDKANFLLRTSSKHIHETVVFVAHRESYTSALLDSQHSLLKGTAYHKSEGGPVFILFRGHSKFESFQKHVTQLIAYRATEIIKIEEFVKADRLFINLEEHKKSLFKKLINEGLLVKDKSPELLALKCFMLSRTSESALSKAYRAVLCSDKDRKLFDDIILSLFSGTDAYSLHIEDNDLKNLLDESDKDKVLDQIHGGLSVSKLDTAIRAIKTIDREAEKQISETCFAAIKGERLDPHVREMQAASTHFHFSVEVPGETLASKIWRFAKLNKISELIEMSINEPQKKIEAQTKKAAQNLISISEGSRLSHTKPGSKQEIVLNMGMSQPQNQKKSSTAKVVFNLPATMIGLKDISKKKRQAILNFSSGQELLIPIGQLNDELASGALDPNSTLVSSGSYLKQSVFSVVSDVIDDIFVNFGEITGIFRSENFFSEFAGLKVLVPSTIISYAYLECTGASVFGLISDEEDGCVDFAASSLVRTRAENVRERIRLLEREELRTGKLNARWYIKSRSRNSFIYLYKRLFDELKISDFVSNPVEISSSIFGELEEYGLVEPIVNAADEEAQTGFRVTDRWLLIERLKRLYETDALRKF